MMVAVREWLLENVDRENVYALAEISVSNVQFRKLPAGWGQIRVFAIWLCIYIRMAASWADDSNC